MNCGVVYKFKPYNKINGTLFYCFEYFKFLQKYTSVKFYIVDIGAADLEMVRNLFAEKYNTDLKDIIPIKLIDLYGLKLDKTLILDVDTFYNVKEFLSNEIHCFSNDMHDEFRYKTNRTVTYYGWYDYQRFDVKCMLKLNFEIFKPLQKNGFGVFISALDQKHIRAHHEEWKQVFQKPILLKKSYAGIGNLFDEIDSVHYVHTQRDTNNRIIPEAFFYKKNVTIEHYVDVIDSVQLRYDDIMANGLDGYTLSEKDEMVQACLK